jgi:hypothetical protein
MEQQNIIQFLSTCFSETCVQPLGFSEYETHVYLVFCIFNVGRLFTYLPTIAKLRAVGCTGDGQSIWTWICWILANSSLSYYAYIASKYQISDFVWINVINTFMCLVCLFYIIKVQQRAGTLNWIPFQKPKQSYHVTVRFGDDLRQPISDISAQTGMPVSTLVTQAVKEFLIAREHLDMPNDRSNQAYYRYSNHHSNHHSNHQKITKTIGEY